MSINIANLSLRLDKIFAPRSIAFRTFLRIEIKTFLVLICFCFAHNVTSAQTEDIFTPLPENEIHLESYLERDIQNSINNWNKGVVPYSGFVEVFRKGREYSHRVKCGERL